ncbi:MAG: hypothetical protein ABIP02_01580, partial [Arenimonas sp.]
PMPISANYKWARIKSKFIGIPSHFAWLEQELPKAIPWILLWQKAFCFFCLPIALIATTMVSLPQILRVSSPFKTFTFWLVLSSFAAYLVISTAMLGAITWHGIPQLIRNGRNCSWRLIAFSVGNMLGFSFCVWAMAYTGWIFYSLI